MGTFGQGQDHSCPEASLRSITVGPGEPIWMFLWHAFIVNLAGQNWILLPQLVQSHRKCWTKRRRCWQGVVLPMILRGRFKLTQTSDCFWLFLTVSNCFRNSVLLLCWIKCLICILIYMLWKMNRKLQGLWLPTPYPNPCAMENMWEIMRPIARYILPTAWHVLLRGYYSLLHQPPLPYSCIHPM